MLTALLILALIAAVIVAVGVTGYCIGEGFFFWICIGQYAAKGCVYAIMGIIWLISDVNNG